MPPIPLSPRLQSPTRCPTRSSTAFRTPRLPRRRSPLSAPAVFSTLLGTEVADATLERVLKDLGRAEKHHDAFAQKCEKRYRAYRGVLDRTSDAARWTSKLHPPYILQIVETIVGNLIDDVSRFKITPRPFLADMATIENRKT